MRHRKNFVHYLILALIAVAVLVYITPDLLDFGDIAKDPV